MWESQDAANYKLPALLTQTVVLIPKDLDLCLISNVDACLEALPKCLQPWGWLGNHLLQPIGEPGEHTTPHTLKHRT